MPRHPRKESISSIYHVVTRGASRQVIFETDGDRAFFMKRLHALLMDAGGELFAWCLMDNHVHLLVRVSLSELPALCRTLFSGYAGYFNRVHGRTGPLFDGRFRSEAVESDEYLMTVVRYIHQNPAKAGLPDGLLFPWSSYREYLTGLRGWAEKGFVLGVFGGTDSFRKFHETDGGGFRCLDLEGEPRRLLSDEEARRRADGVLGSGVLPVLKSLPRAERDAGLAELKRIGLSVRQIQRLTGISIGVISGVAV